jgi:hypothetical protein
MPSMSGPLTCLPARRLFGPEYPDPRVRPARSAVAVAAHVLRDSRCPLPAPIPEGLSLAEMTDGTMRYGPEDFPAGLGLPDAKANPAPPEPA